MKIDFQNLNIQPMPNPKMLSVSTLGQDGKNGNTSDYGFIRNASVHPSAIAERR
jgi:hypothetical protein